MSRIRLIQGVQKGQAIIMLNEKAENCIIIGKTKKN